MKSFLDLFKYKELLEDYCNDNIISFKDITYENHEYDYAWFNIEKSEISIFDDHNFDKPVLKFNVFGLRKLDSF